MDNITPPYVCLDCLNRAWRKDDPCPRCGTMLMHVRSLESKPGKGWRETLEKEKKEGEGESLWPAVRGSGSRPRT